jgi:hypothetical protein
MECPICDAPNEDELCEHFVLMYDCTFPYATGMSLCALEVSSDTFDTSYLDRLVEAVLRVLPRFVEGGSSDRRTPELPRRVVRLLETVAEYAVYEDGEMQTDSYVDLRAYREYLEACITGSGIEVRRTSFEDSIPCASSAFRIWWSIDVEGVSRAVEKQIEDDIAALRGFEAES